MMKLARFVKHDQPLVIEQVDKPTPGPGELLVKVASCGICGSDIHGTSEGGMYTPGTIMGHEFTGEIVEVGTDQKDNWSIGERVTSFPAYFCGECESCLNGQQVFCEQLELIGVGLMNGAVNAHNGAFADYVVIDAKAGIRLAPNVSNEIGTLIEPLATSLHGFNWGKDAAKKQGMLVIGGGPIGLGIALWGQHQGIANVAISERSPERLEMAKHVTTHVIDASQHSDPVAAYTELTGAPPSVIYEAVGKPGIIQSMLPSIAPHTQIVVVGTCMEMDHFHPATACFKEVTLSFSIGYDMPEFQYVADCLAREEIDPSFLITDTISLDDLPDAFEALRQPTGQCKVMVRPN